LSTWFFMLGEPLASAEHDQVREYLRGLELDSELPIESVPDWASAEEFIASPDWDRRWWDAEQRETRRLYAFLGAAENAAALLDSLAHTLDSTGQAVHGAAAVAAARHGCANPALIRAAAGSASQAIYLGELAALAGEPASHSFRSKLALYEGGHWPLGIVRGRYYVF